MSRRELTVTILIFCFSLVVLTNCGAENEGYIIEGNVKGFQDSTKLYLSGINSQPIDSAYVIDGNFKFEGKVNNPKRMTINRKYVKGQPYYYTYLWVENSIITIKGEAENFKYASIKGSGPQETANILKEETKPYYKIIDSLDKAYRKMRKKKGSKKNIRQVRRKRKKYYSKIKNIRKKFIKEYTNSYVAVDHLNAMKYELPKDTVNNLYNSLKPKYKNSIHAEPISTYLNADLAKVGEKFIDIKAKTLEGKSFQLSNEIGKKYILLEFWNAGCGGCRYTNKFLSGKYSDLKEDIKLIGFSLNKSKKEITKAIEEDNISWNVVTNLEGRDGEPAIKYQIHGTPTLYLINPSGEIEEKFVGFGPEQLKTVKSIIG